jgi:hypothetical protein
LLSSTILFNIKQNLNYETLKQLKLAVELPNLIKMKVDDVFVSNSTLISQLAPKLVIVVRDSEINLMDED